MLKDPPYGEKARCEVTYASTGYPTIHRFYVPNSWEYVVDIINKNK